MRPYHTLKILLLIFLSGTLCFGQDVYFVNGKVFTDDTETNGITISLINNSTVTNLPVTAGCSFSAKLKWNRKYHFKFMKSGFVTKIIEFSTFIPDGHTHRIEPYSLNVKLFPVFEGVDKVFFKKPVAKVYFDEKINDFTDDRDYALQVVYAIEQMKKSAEKRFLATQKRESLKTKKGEDRSVDAVRGNAVNALSSAESLSEPKVKEEVYDKYLLPPLKKEYADV
jgi:hypothetical protein